MRSIIAPPSLFSAYAIANWEQLGSPPDPDLQPGTHLRVYTGTGASFPIVPFCCFPATSFETERLVSRWVSRDGEEVPPKPGSIGALDVSIRAGDDWRRLVRLDLRLDNASWADVALLDQRDRVILRRTTEPWLFAAPLLQKLFIASDADHASILARIVGLDGLVSWEPGDALGVFGLPEKGTHPWYVGIHTRDDAIGRVQDGAPLRITPMDLPNGPFWPASADDEAARLEALIAASPFADGIEAIVQRLVDDDSLPPWQQAETRQLPTNTPSSQSATLGRLAALQLAAIDPGMARFFGFSTRLEFKPDLEGGGGPDTLAIATMIVFDPVLCGGPIPELADDPWTPAPMAEDVQRLIVATLAEQVGWPPEEVEAGIQRITDLAAAHGLLVAPFITLVAPTPPWQPPDLAPPLPFDRFWEQTGEPGGSTRYRSSFAFQEPPLASLAAFARAIDGDLHTLHEPLANGRAMPGFFGSASPATDPSQTLPPAAGVLADQQIPASPAVVTYQVCVSDCFGRFGNPVGFSSDEPPRPRPPKPTLRFAIDRDPVDQASMAARSPGRLVVTVAVPAPSDPPFDPDDERLKSAIVVPRIDQLAAGARPLASLRLDLEGNGMTMPLDTPGFFRQEIALPALLPQAKGSWLFSGTYTDSDLHDSETATARVEATDRRPPLVIPSGVGAYWTSAPGPSPDVEVRLRWPAPPASKHRVYLADANAIGVAASSPAGVPPARGLIAAQGCKRVRSGAAIDPDRFSLLTPEAVEAGGDGMAVLDTRLPRTLETVQFLRIVPLGPDGAEPAFAACGIVPVAVPELRNPLPPRLEATVDAATGSVTLAISTDSLGRDVLLRDEPGLFDPTKPGKEPPEFRVRRAASGLADPIYARTVGSGALARATDDGNLVTFAASWPPATQPERLRPFVRTTYWAEVRMPPERRLPAGWIPEEPPGGATTVDPAGAQPHPRPYSPLSAPLPIIWIPAERPAAPEPGDITVAREDSAGVIRVTLHIANPPVAHPLAIDRYRLAVWSQIDGGTIERVTQFVPALGDDAWPELTGDAVDVAIPLPAGGNSGSPVILRIGIVDPAGRLGGLTEVPV